MPHRDRRLSELAALVGAEVSAPDDPTVSDVHHDSREVTSGSLYVALRGSRTDGHDYVDDAVRNGSVAVCVEDRVETTVPQMLVVDTRSALGPLSAEVHHRPSEVVDVVGVTGTNGKTTVTHYVESIAGHAGRRTGLVGTIRTRIGGESVASTMTTPEASELQRLLAEMRDRGVELAAIEVSSHALELGRVGGTRFAVAAFTNLSQDHLDFHGDMTSYRRAKERLFTGYPVGTAVINVDDPVGAEIAAGRSGELLTVGAGADIEVSDIRPGPERSRFRLRTPWGRTWVDAPVVGDFNVANLALAAGCCLAEGIGLDAVVDGMSTVARVPGRFEVVPNDRPFSVVVDYAHTPDGVRRAVEAGSTVTAGRVIALIGAGGDRDRGKRAAMGAAASGADLVVVTSDNPRSEDPRAIVESVSAGVREGTAKIVEVDRRMAIEKAVAAAAPGDLVLILGRGHEPTQEIGGEQVPFDDRLVAAEAIASLGRRSAGYEDESGSMKP